MSNYRKVIINGEVVVDPSSSTASIYSVKQGEKFIGATGQLLEGRFAAQDKTITASTTEIEVKPNPYCYLNKVVVLPPSSQEKTVNPEENELTIIPDEDYAFLSKVVINPIQTEVTTITASTTEQIATPSARGKYLSKVVVNPTPTQEKEVTASTDELEVTPDKGNFLSKVVVNPPPSEILQIIPDGNQYSYTPSKGKKYYSKVEVLPISNAVFSTIDNLIGGGV